MKPTSGSRRSRLLAHVLGEQGSALVESAVALPFVLLLLFGILELGLTFARYQLISNASREGARAATLFRAQCTDGQVRTAITASVRQFGNRLGVAPGELNATPTTTGGNLCVANQITVRVTYRNEFIALPGLARLFGDADDGVTLAATTTMMNERRGIPQVP